MPRHLAALSLHPASAQRSQRYHNPQLKRLVQMRRRRTRCAARSSAWGDVQYAAAPEQHVALDAQQVAEREAPSAPIDLHASLGPCSTSALHRLLRGAGRDMSEATRAIARNVCKRARSVAPSCRSPHLSHRMCRARRGGRTPSSRGQPASR